MKAILEFTHDIADGMLLVNNGMTCVCGDAKAHEIRFTAKENGVEANLTGAACKAYAILPNRATTQENATIAENVISVTFPEAFYALAGNAAVMLRLLRDGTKYDVLLIRYNIIPGTTTTVYDPAGQLPDIHDFEIAIEACEAATAAANTAAGSARSEAAAANTAAAEANTAKTAANSAASRANTAAASAEGAASDAILAAGDADDAADAANLAAAGANEAAGRVDAAIQTADTAAAGADTARDAANTAASGANAAKAAANTAAGTANEKAQEAAEAAAAALAAKQDALTAAAGANQAADTIDNMTAEATPVEPGGAPTVAVGEKDGHKHLTLGIPRGDKGDKGDGYTIKGQAYATVAALQAAVPSPAVGDQYNVGAAAPYNVYRWTGSAWEDQGTIQGQSGQDGVSPTANVVKTGRTATITITDVDGTSTATVLDGLDGADGADAPPTVHVGDTAPTGGETVWVKPGAPEAGTTGEDIPVSKTDATKIDVALMGKADAAETVAALAGKQAAITSDNAETVRAALGLSKAATAEIKTGSVYVTAAANANVSQPFEFPEPFGVSLYGIVLTLGSGNPRDCAVAVSGATVTGFNAILGNASAAEVTARIFYFALGI